MLSPRRIQGRCASQSVWVWMRLPTAAQSTAAEMACEAAAAASWHVSTRSAQCCAASSKALPHLAGVTVRQGAPSWCSYRWPGADLREQRCHEFVGRPPTYGLRRREPSCTMDVGVIGCCLLRTGLAARGAGFSFTARRCRIALGVVSHWMPIGVVGSWVFLAVWCARAGAVRPWP